METMYDWAGSFQMLMDNAAASNQEWWFGFSGAVFFFAFCATMTTCFSKKELPFKGKEFHDENTTAPYLIFSPIRAAFIYGLGVLILSLVLLSVIQHWPLELSLIVIVVIVLFLGRFILKKYNFSRGWIKVFRIRDRPKKRPGCLIILLFFYLGPLLLLPGLFVMTLLIAGPAALLSDPYNTIDLRFNPPVVIEGSLISRTPGAHASETIVVNISQARYLENSGLGRHVNLPDTDSFHGTWTSESQKLKPGDKVIFTEVSSEICTYVLINETVVFKPHQKAESDEKKESFWELVKIAGKALFKNITGR